MFELIKAGPTGSDETAPYDVLLNGEYTVRLFIEDVLRNDRDWGHIGIYDGEHIFGCPSCNYTHGELLSLMPKKYLNRKVKSVKASGGWSLMDYLITLEDA